MNSRSVIVIFVASMVVFPLYGGGKGLHSKLFVPIVEKAKPHGSEMTFAKDGKLDFAIVIDKDAEKRVERNKAEKAIEKSVKYLKREFGIVFGSEPAVVDENDVEALGKFPYWLVVGDSKTAHAAGVYVSDLPDQGFAVKSFERGLVIAGRDSSLVPGYNGLTRLDKLGSSMGTYYGAIDFVNRFLGVVYFFPGQYGTHRPKLRELVVSPVYYEDAPYFNHRGSTYYYRAAMMGRNLEHWERLMGKIEEEDKVVEYWRIGGGTKPQGGGHCPDPLWYGSIHTNELRTIFYTSPSGKFWYHPKSYMANYFNVVNLGFADLLIEDWKKVIDSDGAWNFGGNRPIGGRQKLFFGVCDVMMTPKDMVGDPTVEELGLMTEKDLALGGDRAFANVYARFHQYLARRAKELWPDSKVWLMPYYNCYYASTDPKWRLPDNVEIKFCARDFPLYMRDLKRVEKTVEMLRDWYVALGNRPAQCLWLYNSRNNLAARALAPEFIADIPKVCGKYLGRDGGVSHDYDGAGDIWNHYYSAYVGVMSQWNPDFDVDAAIDAHWDLFYGPRAGPHLKRFHHVLKDCYLKYFLHSKDAYPQYPIECIDELERCLKDAEASLAPDSVEMKRLRVLAEPWPSEFERRRILARYVTPIYAAKRVAKGTVRDSAFWAGVDNLKLFRPDKDINRPIRNRTDVKIAWDDDNIYLHVDGHYAPKATKGVQVWQNDTVEAFFCPGLGKERRYQVVMDPLGSEWTQFDRLLPVPQPSDRTWRPKKLMIETSVSESEWHGDIVLPFSGMECEQPTVGAKWNFNVVRTVRVPGRSEVSGSSLTMGNHGNTTTFGILRFDD